MKLTNLTSKRSLGSLKSTFTSKKKLTDDECNLFKKATSIFGNQNKETHEKIILLNEYVPGLADVITDLVNKSLQKDTNRKKSFTKRDIDNLMFFHLQDFFGVYKKYHFKKCPEIAKISAKATIKRDQDKHKGDRSQVNTKN